MYIYINTEKYLCPIAKRGEERNGRMARNEKGKGMEKRGKEKAE